MTAVRAVEQSHGILTAQRAGTWVNGSGGALMADYLPEEHVPSMFGDCANAGSFGANGTAVPVEGGYRVTGAGVASGCHNATFFAEAEGYRGRAPRMLPNGAPDIQIMMMPASECRIIDMWTSAGTARDGVHDFEAQDVSCRGADTCRSSACASRRRNRASRGYATNFFAMQGPLMAGVALGIARDAIESFRELVGRRRSPRGGGS